MLAIAVLDRSVRPARRIRWSSQAAATGPSTVSAHSAPAATLGHRLGLRTRLTSGATVAHLRPGNVTGTGSAQAGAHLGAAQRRQVPGRLAPRRQLAQPLGGDAGDRGDRLLEGLVGGGGRAGDAADLADVLAGGGLDLLGGGGRLQAPEGGDVAAHAPDATRPAARRRSRCAAR